MTTTVALHGRIFELPNPERAAEADAWIAKNLGDTSLFSAHFPDAVVISSVMLSGIPYHLFREATSFGDAGWIPSARVVFGRKDGLTERGGRDLAELGTFTTAAQAQDTVSSVQVTAIRKDGSVVFAHEQQ
jgi:hypothetical protein